MKLEEYIDDLVECGLLVCGDERTLSTTTLPCALKMLSSASHVFRLTDNSALLEVLNEFVCILIKRYKYSSICGDFLLRFDHKIMINLCWDSHMSEPYGIDCYVDDRR